MRKIFFVLLLAAFFIPVSGQTPAKIKINKGGLGKIAVIKGKISSIVDLSKDVAGCPFVTAVLKRDLDEKGCTAPPASFKLVDATEKNKQIFLILTANAQENCNVCGRCGASEASTVIWLKLDSRLRVLDKQNVPIEYCQFNISTVSPVSVYNEETQEDSMNLSFKNNVMVFEFEKRIFGDETNGDKDAFEVTRVEYDRTKPEKAFVIKIDKREKSSVESN